MKITTFKPNIPILNKYVEFYYEATLEEESYLVFPHYTLPTTISNNINYECIDDKVYLARSAKTDPSFITYNRFKNPIEIIVKGKINEFCVVFKPYGLAQFLKTNIQFDTEKKVSVIDIFDDFIQIYPLFFEFDTLTKIKTFDNYLLVNLQEKKDTKVVIKALKLMENQELSLSDIAKECNCSAKKMSRLFHKLCYESPITFKRIVGFRTALKRIQDKSPESQLSDIALDTGYCDQAYFNNVFKKLTKNKPNEFFKNVKLFSDGAIIFKK